MRASISRQCSSTELHSAKLERETEARSQCKFVKVIVFYNRDADLKRDGQSEFFA
jgi:hypothetical protein